ncbi:hypothetical protein [Amycolatopsis sp. 195334CR]|uniref:hypothetical protein n=1 Tax=Amycolatopsis sp. 195334CR TaxID=2814588 RepID=UPI001A8C6971|nr:hypothetical protein [Amycolatopsis sp. 195334CR]MBN6040062.1 hypothetical protein [Amycolatopsis sp. 195334CR]
MEDGLGDGEIVDLINQTSDPEHPLYDPTSSFYLHSADPGTPYFAGPLTQSDFDTASNAAAVAFHKDEDDWADRQLFALKVLRIWDVGNAGTPRQVIDGVVIRSTGTAPTTPWEVYDHEFMNHVIGSNVSIEKMILSAECWWNAKFAFEQLQDKVTNAITASVEYGESAWVGHGGDQARAYLTSVATWAQSISRAAALCGKQQQEQINALSNTQHIMAGIPVTKMSPDDINIILEQGGTPTHQYNEIVAAENNRLKAAKTMTEFDQQLVQTSSTTEFPLLPALPHDEPAPVAVDNQFDKPAGHTAQPHPGTSTKSAPAANWAEPAQQPSLPSPAQTVPSPGAPATGVITPATDATAAAAMDTGHGTPPITPGNSHLPNATPGRSLPPTMPPPVMVGPAPPPPATTSSPRTTTSKPGPAPVPPPSAPPGSGGKSTGATPRLLNSPAETSARSNEVRAGAGRTGDPMAPTAPGGNRKAEPDDERKAPPYLIDHQTPEIFESDEKTVQPTLGDWAAEQHRRP